ncbi:MAG: EamA family transporter, partial [Anaerolineae bacterium]
SSGVGQPASFARPGGIRQRRTPLSPAGLLNLSVVYVAWGSTYLAIRIAVGPGAGFPPFTLGALRVIVAGAALLLWARLAREELRLSKRELAVLAASGLLLWLGGNGLVVWAEQRADSGLAALLVATAPLWAALTEGFLDRRLPSRLLLGSLALGLAGTGLLSAPVLTSGLQADLLTIAALILAPLFWSLGAVFQSRQSRTESGRVRSAYQHLFGAVGFALLVVLAGEPAPSPTPEAWVAWGYLVVFGSIFGFTAFITAIKLLPMSVAMTYAYVNPIIAVALGAVILKEPITVWTLAGAALILLGVAGVFQDRRNGGAG